MLVAGGYIVYRRFHKPAIPYLAPWIGMLRVDSVMSLKGTIKPFDLI